MKRILIASLLFASALVTNAQSTSKAKDLLKSKKIPEAKAEIDKVVASEKRCQRSGSLVYKGQNIF